MKYIDADKLIAEIERRKYEVFPTDDGKVRVCTTPNQIQSGWLNALKWMRETIISLQQDQPSRKSHKVSWIEETKKELQHEEELLDMRLEALKRIREKKNQFKQEQPEVDWEKAFAHEYAIYHLPNFIIASIVDGTELIDFIYKTARHFYKLGLNARKK